MALDILRIYQLPEAAELPNGARAVIYDPNDNKDKQIDPNLFVKEAIYDRLDFNPQTATEQSYNLGRIFYDSEENAFTAYNDIEGISLQLGEELRARLVNDTGNTLLNGACVSVVGAVGTSLQVELTDATDQESSIRGFGLITIETINGSPGYSVRYGAVRGLDTSSFSAGDIIYADPSNIGGLTNVRPKAPYYPIRIGICILSDLSNGVIAVDTLAFNGSDTSVNIEGALNGMVTNTPDVQFSVSGGIIYADLTNEQYPTRNLPFLIDGIRYNLDVLTNTGNGGAAQVQIPPGTDTTLQESLMYIYLNNGVPTFAVSTSEPNVPYARIGTVAVYSATRTDTEGNVYAYRRANNTTDRQDATHSGSHGLLEEILFWIRTMGSSWLSGLDATPTVNNTTIRLALTAGVGRQFRRTSLPIFDGLSYRIMNDESNVIGNYPIVDNLTAITTTAGGATNDLLSNNRYYTIRLFYQLNSNGIGNRIIATRPTGYYTSSAEAIADSNSYATDFNDSLIEEVVFPIYDFIIGRTGTGGSTITLVELTDRRSKLPYGSGGGGGTGGGGVDEKFRISATDTTADYGGSKLTASEGITTETVNQAGNEQLNFSGKNLPFFLSQFDGFNTVSTGVPAGKWRLNNIIDQSAATAIYINVLEFFNDADNTAWLNKLKSGSVIKLYNRADKSQYITATLTADVTITSGIAAIPLSVNDNVDIDDGAVCGLQFLSDSLAHASSDGSQYVSYNGDWQRLNGSIVSSITDNVTQPTIPMDDGRDRIISIGASVTSLAACNVTVTGTSFNWKKQVIYENNAPIDVPATDLGADVYENGLTSDYTFPTGESIRIYYYYINTVVYAGLVNVAVNDGPILETFNPILTFDKRWKKHVQILGANAALSLDGSGNVDEALIQMYLSGDGSYSPTIPATWYNDNNGSFDVNKWNELLFKYSLSGGIERVSYTILNRETVTGLTQLDTPINVQAVNVSETELSVSWDAVSNASSYDVEVSDDGSTGWTLLENTTNLSANQTGLTNGTTKYYRVKALGDQITYSDSAYSSVVNATTSSSTTLPTPTLTLSNINSITNRSTWTNVSGETGFQLERSDDGVSGWSTINSAGVDVLSYDDNTCNPDQQYFYRVKALGNGSTILDSAYSTVQNIITSSVIAPNLEITAFASGSISLLITDVDTNVDSITLTRDTNSDFSTEVAVEEYTSPNTSVTDASLTNEQLYYYRVKVTVNGVDSVYASLSSYAVTTQAVYDLYNRYLAVSYRPEASKQIAVNNLITSLISSGDWTNIEVLQLYALGANVAAFNIKADANNGTPVNSPTLDGTGGYTMNGSSSYIASGFTPSNASLFSQDSAVIGIKVITAPSSGIDTGALGVFGALNNTDSPQKRIQLTNSTAPAIKSCLNDNTVDEYTTSSMVNNSFYSLSRSSSTSYTLKENNSTLSTISVTSTGLPTIELFVGAYNIQSTGAAGNFNNGKYAGLYIGNSSINEGNVQSALNTFYLAL